MKASGHFPSTSLPSTKNANRQLAKRAEDEHEWLTIWFIVPKKQTNLLPSRILSVKDRVRSKTRVEEPELDAGLT